MFTYEVISIARIGRTIHQIGCRDFRGELVIVEPYWLSREMAEKRAAQLNKEAEEQASKDARKLLGFE